MIADRMTGFLGFGWCRRGFYLPLCSYLSCVIFYTFVTAGIHFFGNFAGKWKSIRANNDVFASKNVPIIIHSLAFGGRGVFIIMGSKIRDIVCKARASANQIYLKGTPITYTHIDGFPEFKETVKTVSIFAIGVDIMMQCMNCWGPLEGLTINHLVCAMVMGICFVLSDSLSAHFANASTSSSLRTPS